MLAVHFCSIILMTILLQEYHSLENIILERLWRFVEFGAILSACKQKALSAPATAKNTPLACAIRKRYIMNIPSGIGNIFKIL